MAKPKGSKNTKKGKFKVTFKSLGRIYYFEGTTLEDALSKIEIPGGTKVASVLTVEKDGVKREKIMSGRHAQQLFGTVSPTMREMALKWVHQAFGV